MRTSWVFVVAATVALLAAGTAEAEAKKRKGKRQVVVTKVTKDITIPAQGTASASVACGKAGVVGAGYHDAGGSEGVAVAQQGASGSGKRWTMTLGNSTLLPQTATVGAHCLKGKRGIKTKYAKDGRAAAEASAGRKSKLIIVEVARQVTLSPGLNVVLLDCPRGFLPFSFMGTPPAVFDPGGGAGFGLEFESMVERETGKKSGIVTHIRVEEEKTVQALLLCWSMTGGGLDFDTHTDEDLPRSPKKKDVNMKLVSLFGEIPANGSRRAGAAAAQGSIGQACPVKNSVVIGATPLPAPSAELTGSRPRPGGSGWDGEFLGGESGESFGQITSCLQGGKKIKMKYRG